MMNDEELEKLIKSNTPNTPYIECDSKRILQRCKIQINKNNNQMFKFLLTICCCAVICFITALVAIQIVNNNANNTIALNVDMGKNPYLAKDGLSQELFEAIKANDPNWEPVFDKLVAFGPESANGTFILDVINKSNLLSYDDKQVLLEYESSIKKHTQVIMLVFKLPLVL